MGTNRELTGTPQSLDETIMRSIMIGRLDQVPENAYHAIKDFLAQRFGAAMLKAGDNEKIANALQELFENITRREK